GVGLGKTHLMHAVGHFVIAKFPQAKVLYITTEKFMGEVIEAIGKGSMTAFRERFRKIDLLLIDDIQFLAESEATQEEFFHMFNILHESNRQIIITSDRPPKQLVTLEDRLRSRFEWGLIADIKSPNLETRVAILKKKIIDDKVSLDENMLLYIASKLKSNIRELEGFLKRINAYAELTGKNVDMDLVKSIMKELLPEEEEADTHASSSASMEQPPTQPSSPPVFTQPPPSSTPTPPPVQPVRPATIGFSVPPPAVTKTPAGSKPPSGGAQPRISAGDADMSLTPIEVGFFYPEGAGQDFQDMKEKFKMIIKKHKLKFRLDPVFEKTYVFSGKIDYAQFAEHCKSHNIQIAIVLGPPPESSVMEDDFGNVLGAIMEDERISLQLVNWKERAKDYRYLNLSLDITLLRHRKPGSSQ
ncbi:MAG: hypothetical protein GF384_07040, partial [Elusimicrobia bacterium]|nr:hypothetical protein [Elusimicrobiota bacterium]MBD3412442.1 hypothetical protein [Elusimicrobiota bacterium]